MGSSYVKRSYQLHATADISTYVLSQCSNYLAINYQWFIQTSKQLNKRERKKKRTTKINQPTNNVNKMAITQEISNNSIYLANHVKTQPQPGCLTHTCAKM